MAILCSTAVRSKSPLEEALREIAAVGLRQVDLLAFEGWAHVSPRLLAEEFERTYAQVRAGLEQHNVAVRALNAGVSVAAYDRSPAANAQRQRETEGLLRLARCLGAQVIAVQSGRPTPEHAWETISAASVASLREQSEAGKAAGIIVALELHIRSVFETLEQARWLFEALPDLAIAYDPSHFVMQGVDVRETAWLLERAQHVHLRDAARGQMQVPYGTGEVDFDWLFGALKERGYSGHIAIEYLENEEFDALDSALRLYEAASRHFPA